MLKLYSETIKDCNSIALHAFFHLYCNKGSKSYTECLGAVQRTTTEITFTLLLLKNWVVVVVVMRLFSSKSRLTSLESK